MPLHVQSRCKPGSPNHIKVAGAGRQRSPTAQGQTYTLYSQGKLCSETVVQLGAENVGTSGCCVFKFRGWDRLSPVNQAV